MTLQTLCKPRPSVFAADRRATVLSLDTFLKGKVNGEEFFEENYFTTGMSSLVDRALRQLGGIGADSSVFMLSQAMGGGKTHSMIALGLLAKDKELREAVLGKSNPAPNLGVCRVIGFNGRNTDAEGGIWGSLAKQIGNEGAFSAYVTPFLKAPGPEAWKQLLNGDPVIIFLDELPPYLEYAVTVPVGNADLSVVTTTALANLFVAVAEMSNVCLVISDLAGTNFNIGQASLQGALQRAIQGITAESRRIAVPITPVNPNGDELYHILRKRLFESVANETEITKVAEKYREALRDANKMGLTTTSPETIYTRIMDAYPFHPDWRELIGKFKENEGFQQTRGVIRLMQMVVANLWRDKKAEQNLLIHPYDIDLNTDELASEIRTINTSLSEAIAHDVAHGGDSEVEQIDISNGNTDASDASKLILISSLSTTPGATHGLREYQLVDCLQRPGRDLSSFKTNVLDKLATRAWYLHNSTDGRLFFKNQQNLAAKLRSTASSLHNETVERMLRKSLEEFFIPQVKDCYQIATVLPLLDEVQVEQEKTTLVIVRPGGLANQLPISVDWQEWWNQQQYKNRILFLTGTRDTFQKVLDAARQKRALESIKDDLTSDKTPSDDPQWRALDALEDRVALQFSSALKEAFDQLVYPSINNALRTTSIDLAFAGNQNSEATIRRTLETAGKFTVDIDGDSFRTRAEARLFGGADSKIVLWSDFKRAAAVNANWPLHKISALEDLKADCLRRNLWREEGNHVRRGPFPPPIPEVSIRELSVQEDGEGITYLKIEPLHADSLVFETGQSDPTSASSPVPTPARFEAKGLCYRFMAFDAGTLSRISEIKEWKAKIRLKYNLQLIGDHYEVELMAFPKVNGISIRYTTDGSSPTNAGYISYNGKFKVPEKTRVVCAVAISDKYDICSESIKITIPQPGQAPTSNLNLTQPARWMKSLRYDDSGAVWDLIGKLEKLKDVNLFDIGVTVESADGKQILDYSGSIDDGYDINAVKEVIQKLQELIGGGDLRMEVGSIGFETGQALLDWLRSTNQTFSVDKIKQ